MYSLIFPRNRTSLPYSGLTLTELPLSLPGLTFFLELLSTAASPLVLVVYPCLGDLKLVKADPFFSVVIQCEISVLLSVAWFYSCMHWIDHNHTLNSIDSSESIHPL